MRSLALIIGLALVFSSPLVFGGGQPPPKAAPQEKADPDRAKLEEDFARLLSGATLVGHYTANDAPADRPLTEEKYLISKVSKVAGETWLFQVRIQYGKQDVTLPLPLSVKWAGDTPMITLDNVGIPGLGTFTARVHFHDGKYAGTWSGGNHGGHLFGRIEKPKSPAAAKDDEQPGK